MLLYAAYIFKLFLSGQLTFLGHPPALPAAGTPQKLEKAVGQRVRVGGGLSNFSRNVRPLLREKVTSAVGEGERVNHRVFLSTSHLCLLPAASSE